jgi:hypothetical protein
MRHFLLIIALVIGLPLVQSAQWRLIPPDSLLHFQIVYYQETGDENMVDISEVSTSFTNFSDSDCSIRIWTSSETMDRIILHAEYSDPPIIKWINAKKDENNNHIWRLDGMCYVLKPGDTPELNVYSNGWIVK